MRTLFALMLIALVLSGQSFCGPVHHHNRLIVLTDIEADNDDTESMVRLLLYSNVVDVKGLIATTSTHQRNAIHPESITRVIHGYGKVRDNLLMHEPGFPDVGLQLSLVKRGRAEYGMQGVGKGKDSEGSEWIIKVLEERDDRPLWISVWGGPNTLAQALLKIKESRTEAEVKRLIDKLRVYTISDQDDSGIWMRRTFPDLFYIVSPGGYGSSTWSAINQVGPGIKNEVISNRWLAENIQQGHGPLGALYPDVAYGMEGDTPSWLNLVPNGLNAPEHPDWGGWGGRYELDRPEYSSLDTGGFTGGVPVEPEPRAMWTNAVDRFVPYVASEYGRTMRPDTAAISSNKATLWRWREDFQNDFAARMDWCTKSYKEANHPPVPVLAHPEAITVKSGERFCLDARGSTDPDGDNLGFVWFQYPEAGSYKKLIPIGGADNLDRLWVTAPVAERGETVHFILKVTDKGRPQLSRYERVIMTVSPK